jgi:hypothetical protein
MNGYSDINFPSYLKRKTAMSLGYKDNYERGPVDNILERKAT